LQGGRGIYFEANLIMRFKQKRKIQGCGKVRAETGMMNAIASNVTMFDDEPLKMI